MFNRSRRNLARWFTLSMGSIIVVFSAAIYYQEANENLENLDQLLYKKARVMAANVEYELYQGQSRAILDSVPLLGNNPPPLDSEVVYARWYDRTGQLKQFFGAAAPEQLNQTWEFETIKTDNYIEAKPTVTAVCSPMSYGSSLCSGCHFCCRYTNNSQCGSTSIICNPLYLAASGNPASYAQWKSDRLSANSNADDSHPRLSEELSSNINIDRINCFRSYEYCRMVFGGIGNAAYS